MQTNEERNARRRAASAKRRADAAAEIDRRYITSAELKQRGWTKAGIARLGKPDLIQHVGWGERFYWLRDRISECEPIPLRNPKPAEKVDLLMAVFAVNRSAKRRRDAASKFYAGRLHGFASESKRRKDRLYSLKDRGIAAAYLAGRLRYEGHHGGLAIYRGEGYCFHSTLEPLGEAVRELSRDDARIFVESKPRTSTEPRLTDAEFTLAALPEPPSQKFARLDPPRPEARRRSGRSNRPRWNDDGHDDDDDYADWPE